MGSLGVTKRKIVGIDPGSHRTGFALIESEGTQIKLLYAEVIEAPRTFVLFDRLKVILDCLETRLAELVPSEVAIENLFHGKNAKSAFTLGMARGVAIGACLRQGLRIHEYAPTQVKSVVTGHGRADKEQVKKMLEMCLGFELKVGVDATDAIAIAFCHAQSTRLPGLAAKAEKVLR